MTDSSSGQANDNSSFDAPLDPVDAAIADDLVIPDEPVISDGLVVADDLERTQIFGLDFVNAESLDAVIVELMNAPRRDDDVLPVVLTPNVDILVHLDEDQHSIEADLFRRAQYCLPDGQPLVIASRFIGERLQARLPGSGLFSDLWPQIVADKVPVVVVASSDVIAERLNDEHPDAGLIVPPMFDVDDKSAIAEIVDEMLISARAVRPSMIFVGIGNPKDARIIAALFERWDERIGPKPLCLGLGGSFAMYLGLKKRAPAWVQKIGMEWFFRFTQEPRRLFHRYFVRDMAFFNIARREWLLSRSGR